MTAAGEPGPVDALTADGSIVSIRPVSPADRQALAGLYASASTANLRLRFFAQPSAATLAAEVQRLCRPESGRHVNILATEGGAVVGVASAERLGDLPRAEFAVFVADECHGRGIGTLLIEHLAARCRRHGITELLGEVLPGNAGMLRVARDLSTSARQRLDRGVVDVTLGTGDGELDLSAVDARDRAAERASLRAVLSPSSIAVAGAGHRPGSAGREILKALLEYGYTGTLFAINRRGEPIGPVPAFRSLNDLPSPVDLLVVAVPAGQVAEVLADGVRAGVRAAVVLSGAVHGSALVRLAREHGIRLIGPRSLGVYNTDPAVRLAAGIAPTVPLADGLAVAAQSGAVTTAVLRHTARTGVGVSTVVSLDDKADVSGNDLIAYWFDDPATAAVFLHLESFGNPRKFGRTVRALSRRKPVLALRDSGAATGPSSAGARTAEERR